MPSKDHHDFHGSDYDAYLASDHWQSLRTEVLIRDGFRCTGCDLVGFLEVHHLTYERLGHELLEDLVTLCDDCHARLTGVPPRDLESPEFLVLLQRQKVYKRIFLAAHGPFPHACYFDCGRPVIDEGGKRDRESPLIHHIDEDQTNNHPSNLAAAHWGCHSRHHQTGHVVTEEMRRKIRAANLGKKHSDATRRKMSASQKLRPPPSPELIARRSAKMRGQKRSAAARAQMSASQTGKKRAPEAVAKGQATKRAQPDAPCPKCGRACRPGAGLAAHVRHCQRS